MVRMPDSLDGEEKGASLFDVPLDFPSVLCLLYDRLTGSLRGNGRSFTPDWRDWIGESFEGCKRDVSENNREITTGKNW
jgi:hypothetical protein